jgi:hypothetical protein
MATTKATTLAHGQAGSIVSGTLADARIPSLAASKITSGTFATARIADDAINLDKLAHLGTDGHVLTSTGTGSAPAFEAVPASSNLVMPANAVSCSSSGTGAEFTGLNTSAKIIIVTFSGIQYASGAGQGGIQIGTSSAYVTSGYYGGSRYETDSAQASSHDTDHIGIKNIGVAVTYGSIKIERLANNEDLWVYQGQYHHNGHFMETSGGVDAGGNITRLKVVTSSGNWNGAGKISVTQIIAI